MGVLEARAIAAHCDEIRSTIGILALLQAGDEIGDRDMKNAVSIIERELNAITGVAAGRAVSLPVMTLDDVVAAVQRRTPSAPTLTAIDGGRP